MSKTDHKKSKIRLKQSCNIVSLLDTFNASCTKILSFLRHYSCYPAYRTLLLFRLLLSYFLSKTVRFYRSNFPI